MERWIKSKRTFIAGVMTGAAIAFFANALLAGAAADSLSVKKAREIIQKLAGANLDKGQVQIKNISAGVGGGMIVDAQIETAFRIAKDEGDWRIVEVRLGDRQWESFELIEEAVKREKARRTTAILQSLAESLNAYRRERGQFVKTDKMAELLDYLSPRYTLKPHRFDLWGKEFNYRGKTDGYKLFSSGPDLKPGTNDDLVIEDGSAGTD